MPNRWLEKDAEKRASQAKRWIAEYEIIRMLILAFVTKGREDHEFQNGPHCYQRS